MGDVLTLSGLQRVYASLKEVSGAGPTLSERGLRSARWEFDGEVVEGVVDRDGVPVFFGGVEEMRRLRTAGSRWKASGAGLPIALRLSAEQEAPWYDWNPVTETFQKR